MRIIHHFFTPQVLRCLRKSRNCLQWDVQSSCRAQLSKSPSLSADSLRWRATNTRKHQGCCRRVTWHWRWGAGVWIKVRKQRTGLCSSSSANIYLVLIIVKTHFLTPHMDFQHVSSYSFIPWKSRHRNPWQGLCVSPRMTMVRGRFRTVKEPDGYAQDLLSPTRQIRSSTHKP